MIAFKFYSVDKKNIFRRHLYVILCFSLWELYYYTEVNSILLILVSYERYTTFWYCFSKRDVSSSKIAFLTSFSFPFFIERTRKAIYTSLFFVLFQIISATLNLNTCMRRHFLPFLDSPLPFFLQSVYLSTCVCMCCFQLNRNKYPSTRKKRSSLQFSLLCRTFMDSFFCVCVTFFSFMDEEVPEKEADEKQLLQRNREEKRSWTSNLSRKKRQTRRRCSELERKKKDDEEEK